VCLTKLRTLVLISLSFLPSNKYCFKINFNLFSIRFILNFVSNFFFLLLFYFPLVRCRRYIGRATSARNVGDPTLDILYDFCYPAIEVGLSTQLCLNTTKTSWSYLLSYFQHTHTHTQIYSKQIKLTINLLMFIILGDIKGKLK
jgi:hypothetical protein